MQEVNFKISGIGKNIAEMKEYMDNLYLELKKHDSNWIVKKECSLRKATQLAHTQYENCFAYLHPMYLTFKVPKIMVKDLIVIVGNFCNANEKYSLENYSQKEIAIEDLNYQKIAY